MVRQAAMWMSTQQPANALDSLMSFSSLPTQERLAAIRGTAHSRHTDLRCAPLKALCPGISVSRVEPSGDIVSWYCLSSSRSLGRSLLLGQRSRLNLWSDLVRSLLHQHHRRSHGELVSDRHNGHSRGHRTRMPFAHRTKEFSELRILANSRPGSLDQFRA